MGVMGRPKKLKDDRETFTLYIDAGLRKAMDDYIHQIQIEQKGYSRADFVNEAIKDYLAKKARKK